jgi:K(+)-stimulated pyrophosphate-energized sodium pump
MYIGVDENTTLRFLIAAAAIVVIVGAVLFSKRRSIAVGDEPEVEVVTAAEV